MRVDRLDHLVLTVASIEATVEFYTRVLGMEAVTFGRGRRALTFGTSKINLHQAGREFEPKRCAQRREAPTSASSSMTTSPRYSHSWPQPASPSRRARVERTGASRPIISCYLRDPDRNLIELSNYLPWPPQAPTHEAS